MVNYSRWAIVFTVLVTLFGVLYASPNFLLSQKDSEEYPGFLPTRQMNLGLDLQGGSSLLLEVEIAAVVRETMESVESSVRRVLRDERIGYTGLQATANGVRVKVRDPAEAERAEDLLSDIDSAMTVSVANGTDFTLAYTEEAFAERRQRVIEQSIAIVGDRINELGVTEPVVQQQGENRILVQVPGARDPERLKDILGQTAKMTFHLVDEQASVREALDGNVPAGSMLAWSKEETNGQKTPYVVRRAVEVSGERLVDAQPAFDQGQPIVSFRFDTAGGRRFGDLTSANVGTRLAILLDDEVISAPVIRSPIVGGSGIITGNFTVQSANDLALLLRAGALPAPLKILEERTVGPGLGADSIEAGKIASIIGMVAVVVFMVASYGLFGVMAAVALLFNLSLIVALLSVLQATLTLPGIAGIVLTIGMAVDANVLIFERIREEIRNGRTPISAVDAGYRRTLTTIIDSNLTTLIAALLLFQFGSGPIRGFAVTLSIGIVTSMFTAIMLTRLFVVLWLRRRRREALPI